MYWYAVSPKAREISSVVFSLSFSTSASCIETPSFQYICIITYIYRKPNICSGIRAILWRRTYPAPQYPSGDSIRHIASILKQESTYYIWRTHHHKTLARHYWAERTLWSDGHFAVSVGDASAEIIRQYIASQG
ncbi:transposase [Blautia massiliensis (ex Durand et al. 2017)]|uniref:transposase n=1 Tax=Blautia massiliensis (ex Durand et al. 2017) TaxID=1737424 RepID=UPI003FA40654